MEAINKQHRPSERAVSLTMQDGLEAMMIQTSAGLLIGAAAAMVFARKGPAGLRRGLVGFGGGVGLGSAWTRTSMNLEELLSQKK